MNFFESAVSGRTEFNTTPLEWKRVSSSQLKTYELCPRKWHYTYVCRNPTEANEAMSLGTLVHAYLEFYMEFGVKATLEDILKMEGNYDPPSKAYESFPHLLEEAEKMANRVIDEYPQFFGGGWETEIDVEELGIEVEGVRIGGYVDRLRRLNKKIVSDWKTRGSMSYAPRTDADFRADDQLLYYASIMWATYGGAWTVEHINILRGSGDVHRRASVIPEFYLSAVWKRLTEKVIPDMVELAKLDPQEVPTGYEDACYKYGRRCRFADVCNRKADKGFFEFGADNMRILSEQAPEPEYAVPYAQKLIKILPLSSKSVGAARDLGIRTLHDADEWLAGGGGWEDLPGVGKITADKIRKVHESLRATR